MSCFCNFQYSNVATDYCLFSATPLRLFHHMYVRQWNPDIPLLRDLSSDSVLRYPKPTFNFHSKLLDRCEMLAVGQSHMRVVHVYFIRVSVQQKSDNSYLSSNYVFIFMKLNFAGPKSTTKSHPVATYLLRSQEHSQVEKLHCLTRESSNYLPGSTCYDSTSIKFFCKIQENWYSLLPMEIFFGTIAVLALFSSIYSPTSI